MLCTLLAAACGQPGPQSADGPSTLRIGMAEGHNAAQNLAVTLVQEGLTRLTLDGRVLPALAESWRWEMDGRRLRITLRPNVRFHDDTPLTAAVAAEALRGTIRKSARQYPSVKDIVDLHAEGPRELVIDLSRPSSFLPEDLSIPILLKDGDVGTGPYRIVSTQPDVVMESFPKYYLGSPAIQRLVFTPYDSPRTTWSSFLRGELDMVSDVPQNAVEFVRNNDVQVVTFARWYQFVIAFNSRRAPFTSPLVRRALNFAIDRDMIVQRHLQGAAFPATGPVWPKNWAYDASVPTYTFDPGRATALLESARFMPGTAPPAPGRPANMRLRFTCLIPPNFSVWEEVALELQRQLYDVGVDVQFQVVSLDEMGERMASGDFDAVFNDLISGPALGRPYIFWASASALKGLNTFGYENTQVEALFAQLRSSTNDASTRSATRRLQQEFMDDPPALFVTWGQRARAVRKEFRVVRETDRDPVLTLWRWTPATPSLRAATP